MTVPRKHHPARRALVAATVVLLASCSPDGILGGEGNWRPGTSSHDVAVGSLTRNYLLHIPLRRPVSPTTLLAVPYSLYLVLHGTSGTGDDIRRVSQMDSLSETGRFLVAYPNGVKGVGGLYPSDWNAGACCGAAFRENIDDLGFMTALVRQVSARLPVNAKRIYIVGFSDGGMMAYHSACKLSSMVAAIGVVSGSLKDDSCAPGRPVPTIAIHGTSDTQVPYNDNALTPPPQPVSGVGAQLPPSIQFWISRNGCSTGTVVRQSPSVDRATFSPCLAETAFYTIIGGTHAWPGEPAGGPGSQPPMSELRASIVLTQFLSRQSRP